MDKRNLTTEEFIRRARKKHGNRYDYSKTVYTYSREKVIITCRVHGDFEMTPNSHISRGSNCVLCDYKTRGRRNTKDALKRRDWSFEQPEEYKLIPLTRGKFAKVSNEDFDKVKDIPWNCSEYGYAVNREKGKMHRFLMNCEEGREVDHINRDGLDNRRSNLREANRSQNASNTFKSDIKTSSKYVGVYWDKDRGLWVAEVKKDYKKNFVGRFECEEEAGRARDKKAKELHGEFVYLNFPELKG